jgi:hypothetical protein
MTFKIQRANSEQNKKLLEMITKWDQPDLEKVLNIIKSLKDKGLVKEYAISGTYAALYYIEPVLTYDLDVCCIFSSNKKIVDLSALYSYIFSTVPCQIEKEYIAVYGIPVQIITAEPNSLTEEAVLNARNVKYKSVRTKVVTLEYLIAIAIQLGRPKDIAKLPLMIEQGNPDMAVLKNILGKHKLTGKWEAFINAFSKK